MEDHENTVGRQWQGESRASAEADIQDKWVNVRVTGKPGAAAGKHTEEEEEGALGVPKAGRLTWHRQV